MGSALPGRNTLCQGSQGSCGPRCGVFGVAGAPSRWAKQLGVGSGRSVSRLVVLGRHIQEVLGQVLGYGISPTPGRVLWPQVIQLKVLNSPEPSGPMS